MKKLLLYTVIVLLILSTALPALAGTCYVKTPNGKTVNLRSPADNSVLAQIHCFRGRLFPPCCVGKAWLATNKPALPRLAGTENPLL